MAKDFLKLISLFTSSNLMLVFFKKNIKNLLYTFKTSLLISSGVNEYSFSKLHMYSVRSDFMLSSFIFSNIFFWTPLLSLELNFCNKKYTRPPATKENNREIIFPLLGITTQLKKADDIVAKIIRNFFATGERRSM